MFRLKNYKSVNLNCQIHVYHKSSPHNSGEKDDFSEANYSKSLYLAKPTFLILISKVGILVPIAASKFLKKNLSSETRQMIKMKLLDG
jgi:hypothetical protein